MYVIIHHNITDPQKWEGVSKTVSTMIEESKLPEGLHALSYLPSTDGRKADCLWEVDSLDNLKRFLEPQTSAAARNEYFEVNRELSFGLPEVKEHEMASGR